MNLPKRPGSPRRADTPSRLALYALIVLAAIFPPGARGESMAGCAALIALAAVLEWRTRAEHGPARALFLAALAVALLAARAAVAPGAAVEPIAVFALAAAAGIAAAAVGGGETNERQGIVVLALSAVAVATQATYQKLWGFPRLIEAVAANPDLPDRAAVLAKLEGGRVFAGFITPAGLGGFLALALPLTAALAFEARGARRVGWSVAVALLQAFAFVAAASATATAALGGATAFAALVWGARRRALLAGLAGLVVLLAAVGLQREVVLDPVRPGGPWHERAMNFESAWAIAADHPWIGVGPGGFAEVYPQYRQGRANETRHVHNLPLELAADLGWPAAILLSVLFFGLFLRPIWVESRPGPAWRKASAIGLAAFALQNLADFTAFMPSVLWIAAILLGARIGAGRAKERPHPLGFERAVAGASLVAVALAAIAAGLTGLAADGRLEARYASHRGDTDAALRLAARAARLAPWDPDAALLHARASAARGVEVERSLQLAERAVALSPVRPAAREQRARVRLAAGDLAGGLADISEAARLYPRHEGYRRQREQLRTEVERRSATAAAQAEP